MVEIWRLFILLLLVLLILLFLKHWWSRRHFPPGPLSFPVLGNVWVLGRLHEDALDKMALKYGNIYGLYLGNQLVVVLSGFKTVREGLVGHAEEFSGRPDSAFFSSRGKARGQPFDPSVPFVKLVANVICALGFGYQFALEDKKLQKLVQSINNVEKISAGVFHMLFEMAPWLMKHLPGPHQKAMDSAEFIFSLGMQEIERHKRYQSLHEPQDFIDFYLLQIEKNKGDPNSVYNEENLACCLSEFFVAGTATAYSTLMWAVLLLANHPDIQEKVHKEIEEVFGASGSISYQDRHKLPYTNAVIHETQRAKYIILIVIPRETIRDVNMAGFHIPKGTIIAPDFRSVLLDPEQWETPEEFNPNHFLDKDGNFQTREAFMAFGAGQRSCWGEPLARVEIFITLTSLLRTFSLQLPQGVKKLNDKPIVHMGLYPQPYQICAMPRHTMI